MTKFTLTFFMSLVALMTQVGHAQQRLLQVYSDTLQPLSDVLVIDGANCVAVTNALGQALVHRTATSGSTLEVFKHGYQKTHVLLNTTDTVYKIILQPAAVNIAQITVVAAAPLQQSIMGLSQIDKVLRPINSSQDLLQLVPGLFIAQHAGGGKAEQIFLRGFDSDHGTDFYIAVDGMPVNMVSHAHGQGYADFHFVIPETIDRLNVYKGPYEARFGDFSTSGTGEFFTANTITNSQAKLEAGMFDTYRTVALIDLLGNKHLLSRDKENFYCATEYVFSNSYFQSKQHFNRYNFFAKYTGMVTPHTQLQWIGSMFSARWNASGQVPTRAVANGTITRYGSIDNTEGGNTARTNLNMVITSFMRNNATIKNQLYYVRYNFNLYSNFTFYARDSVNGDGINQHDDRHIVGYNASYANALYWGSQSLHYCAGLNVRADFADIALANQSKRIIRDTVIAGNVQQQNTAAYVDAVWKYDKHWSVQSGLRYDYYVFNYLAYPRYEHNATAHIGRLSPKLNFSYSTQSGTNIFFKNGIGFHSNDARAVVAGTAQQGLPRAYGSEIGLETKIGKRTLLHSAIWMLYLQSELVYVGDEGTVETTSPTMRKGIDCSIRIQLTKNIMADIDVNYNHGRLTRAPHGKNYIPLAPAFTTAGGVSYQQAKGTYASIRYRHMPHRAANEDYSITAQGYFIVDAIIGHTFKRFDAGISIENLFNTQWNQAQFDTTSRLQNESTPMSELHFTPGTPFFAKAFLKINF